VSDFTQGDLTPIDVAPAHPPIHFASLCGRVTQAPAPAHKSACAKAIIVGEHAVIYGAAAVAMPLSNLRIQVSLQPRSSWMREDAGRKDPVIRMTLGNKRVSPHLKRTVHEAFSVLGVNPFPVDIEGHSSVYIGAGLGSSAALCVVLLRVISQSLGMSLSEEELAYLANKLEARFHGTPSGLDTATVALEEIILFRRGVRAQPIAIPSSTDQPRWRFVLIDSGVRASTLAMVKIASPWFQGAKGESRIAGFDAASRQAADRLAQGDIMGVADAMNRTGAWLREAGVVTDQLTDIINTAVGIGAVAAKTTGAGGGGCVLALLPSSIAAEEALSQLKASLPGLTMTAVEVS